MGLPSVFLEQGEGTRTGHSPPVLTLGFVQDRQRTSLRSHWVSHGHGVSQRLRGRRLPCAGQGCPRAGQEPAGLSRVGLRGEGEERVKPTLDSGGGLCCYKQ